MSIDKSDEFISEMGLKTRLLSSFPKKDRFNRNVWSREDARIKSRCWELKQQPIKHVPQSSSGRYRPVFCISELGGALRRDARIKQQRRTGKLEPRTDQGTSFSYPHDIAEQQKIADLPVLARRTNHRPNAKARSPQDPQERADAAAFPIPGGG